MSPSTPSDPSDPVTPDRSTSVSSFRPRFAFPAPGSPEFGPAAACLALTLIAALEFGLSSKTELPQDSGLAARRPHQPAAAPIPAYPALAASNVFSPDRAAGSGAGEPASIEQCSAVGVIAVGRAAAALVKPAGGAARLVRAGETACGWRLSQIAGNTLVFIQNGQRRRLVVGEGSMTAARSNPEAPQGAEPTQ
jgi:hypothetical protein